MHKTLPEAQRTQGIDTFKVQNLATRWHILHWLQIWPPDGATCIAALPWIALLALSVSIELVSSSARVTSV